MGTADRARRLAGAALGRLPPETAQRLGLALLRRGIGVPDAPPDRASLRIRLGKRTFPAATGIAAGLDKDGTSFDALLRSGAGFVEVGTVTPLPQPGNPAPRLFRLRADGAIINRLGFNSAGAARVARRLARRDRSKGIVGVNIGANRDSDDPVADYAAAFDALAPHADYVAVNISSPNTPGLRGLQAADRAADLIDRLHARRRAGGLDRPILIKIAPDLDPEGVRDIAGLALDKALDGLIASNTTVARPPGLRSRRRGEAGGLSGKPLFARSTALLRDLYRLTEGRIPLVGVGGVAGASDAYAKIRAGASLVQLYTALAYRGLDPIAEIGRGLARRLDADGLSSVADAVGADERGV